MLMTTTTDDSDLATTAMTTISLGHEPTSMFIASTINLSTKADSMETSPSPSPSMLAVDAPHAMYDFGPSRDSLYIVVPVTIVYAVIFITGIIGNISTCIVIKKNRSMHTATNYYLFSLAISDFLLLISGVPQEMYFIWSKYPYVFGEYFCIGRGILAETSANATVLTITAFTAERYVAICHPFWGQAMSKLSRALRIIVLIWVLSILTAIPQAAQFGIVSLDGIEKCAVVRQIIEHSFELSTFIFFFAPMTIILILYLLIGLRLYRSNIMGGGGGNASESGHRSACTSPHRSSTCRQRDNRAVLRSTQSDNILYRYSGGGTQLSAVRGRMNQYGTRRVLKMLVAVVICFFLCWAPFHAQRLIAVYGVDSGRSSTAAYDDDDDDAKDDDVVRDDPTELPNIEGLQSVDNTFSDSHVFIFTVLTYVSGVLYYLSTCINPFLYNIMSHKFREAFKAILFGKKSKGSLTSRRTQESSIKRLRRNPTLTSTTQRESSDSELQTKQSLMQAVVNERRSTVKK